MIDAPPLASHRYNFSKSPYCGSPDTQVLRLELVQADIVDSIPPAMPP